MTPIEFPYEVWQNITQWHCIAKFAFEYEAKEFARKTAERCQVSSIRLFVTIKQEITYNDSTTKGK